MRPAGVIYLRADTTGTVPDYVGQAKSWERFLLRMGDHEDDSPNSSFEFHVLDRAAPGTDLDVAEESWMRAGGGAKRIIRRRRCRIKNR